MKRSWVLLSILALHMVAVPLWGSRPAWANTQDEEAKNHFQTGLRLYKEGAVDAALIQFQEAYRLGNRASALRNVAQCQRDLRDFAAAHDSFERLLSSHSAELTEPDRANVSRALAELALLTGFIDVGVTVAGATLEVNGSVVGTSPLAKPLRANVGVYKIRVTKDGHEAFETSATVVVGKSASVNAQLRPELQTGRVVIRAKGDRQVPVFVDGTKVGVTPWEGDLPPGQRRIQLKDELSSTSEQVLEVVARGTHELVLDPLATHGRVEVSATPAMATIEVNEKEVGRGGWTGELPSGTHRVRVSSPGFVAQTVDVDVEGGRVNSQNIMLAEKDHASRDPFEKQDAWDGPYLGLALNPDLLGSATEHPECPAHTDASCKQMRAIGAALLVRLGYSFGYVGAEIVGGVRFQMHEDSREFSNLPEEQTLDSPYFPYAFYRREIFRRHDVGAYMGAGPRLLTQGKTRFTAGAAMGVNFRSFTVNRSAGSASVNFPASYTAPSLVMDVALMFGSTPGGKVVFGILGQLDFPRNVDTEPDTRYFDDVFRNKEGISYSGQPPSYAVARGPQFFFGPVLGAQWGY